jgi:hypothetical protein
MWCVALAALKLSGSKDLQLMSPFRGGKRSDGGGIRHLLPAAQMLEMDDFTVLTNEPLKLSASLIIRSLLCKTSPILRVEYRKVSLVCQLF